MPMGQYSNFQECVNSNRDKRDPNAYCGSIYWKTEGREDKAMRGHTKDIYGKKPGETGRGPKHTHPHKTGPTSVRKTIDSASYLHQSVRAALVAVVTKHKDKRGSTAHHKYYVSRAKAEETREKTRERKEKEKSAVAKGHDPVKEEGKKKLTANDGTANEGAQDDQAFAVAFGPDNYDKLTKTIIAAPYQQAYNAAGTILKALENKQFNFPGNIEEHMKKAHAAIHGREMWDARYSDVCDLITQARKILHSIEKTAEVSQGGSGMMVVGKADPGREVSKHRDSEGSTAHHRKGLRPQVPVTGVKGKGPKHGHSTATPYRPEDRHEHEGGGQEHHHQFTTAPKYHKARKAVQKAIKAVRGR